MYFTCNTHNSLFGVWEVVLLTSCVSCIVGLCKLIYCSNWDEQTNGVQNQVHHVAHSLYELPLLNCLPELCFYRTDTLVTVANILFWCLLFMHGYRITSFPLYIHNSSMCQFAKLPWAFVYTYTVLGLNELWSQVFLTLLNWHDWTKYTYMSALVIYYNACIWYSSQFPVAWYLFRLMIIQR